MPARIWGGGGGDKQRRCSYPPGVIGQGMGAGPLLLPILIYFLLTLFPRAPRSESLPTGSASSLLMDPPLHKCKAFLLCLVSSSLLAAVPSVPSGSHGSCSYSLSLLLLLKLCAAQSEALDICFLRVDISFAKKISFHNIVGQKPVPSILSVTLQMWCHAMQHQQRRTKIGDGAG